jgi:hypothetical protein
MIPRDEFLLPLTRTEPDNGMPPVMEILSKTASLLRNRTPLPRQACDRLVRGRHPVGLSVERGTASRGLLWMTRRNSTFSISSRRPMCQRWKGEPVPVKSKAIPIRLTAAETGV